MQLGRLRLNNYRREIDRKKGKEWELEKNRNMNETVLREKYLS